MEEFLRTWIGKYILKNLGVGVPACSIILVFTSGFSGSAILGALLSFLFGWGCWTLGNKIYPED